MITAIDILELAEKFVPEHCRHDSSTARACFDASTPKTVRSKEWWPAHELGHAVVASACEFRFQFFGIADGDSLYPWPDHYPRTSENYRRSMELAAMSVSKRLLEAAGEAALADEELQGTDETTLEWEDRGMVRRILRRRDAINIPTTSRAELEAWLHEHIDHKIETSKTHRSASRVVPYV